MNTTEAVQAAIADLGIPWADTTPEEMLDYLHEFGARLLRGGDQL